MPEYEPAVQSEHESPPPTENCPLLQSEQVLSAAFANFPGPQKLQDEEPGEGDVKPREVSQKEHVDEPAAENSPSPQSVQSEADAEERFPPSHNVQLEAAMPEYEPAVQSEQEVTPPTENCPMRQSEQVLSVTFTCLPGPQ